MRGWNDDTFSCFLSNRLIREEFSEGRFIEDLEEFPPGCTEGVSFNAFNIFAVSDRLIVRDQEKLYCSDCFRESRELSELDHEFELVRVDSSW